MGAGGAMVGKLRRPDVDYSNKRGILITKGNKNIKDGIKFAVGGPSIIRGKSEQLTAARKTFVAKTGRKLKDVKTAGLYKSMTRTEKNKYKKLNPKEFEVGSKLSTKSLLGKA
jgi:hypothetical protein